MPDAQESVSAFGVFMPFIDYTNARHCDRLIVYGEGAPL